MVICQCVLTACVVLLASLQTQTSEFNINWKSAKSGESMLVSMNLMKNHVLVVRRNSENISRILVRKRHPIVKIELAIGDSVIEDAFGEIKTKSVPQTFRVRRDGQKLVVSIENKKKLAAIEWTIEQIPMKLVAERYPLVKKQLKADSFDFKSSEPLEGMGKRYGQEKTRKR